MDTIQSLTEENLRLKRILRHSTQWMQREVLLSQNSLQWKKELENTIISFLPPGSTFYIPRDSIDHLVSAEVLFRYLSKEHFIDGVSIII